MFLKNVSIGRRLALVLGTILVLSAASSLFAVSKLKAASAGLNAMVADNVQTEQDLSDWLRYTTSGVQRAAAIAKSSDTALVDYFAAASAESIRLTTELQKRIETKMDTPNEKAMFEKLGELRKVYLAAREDVSKFKKAGDAAGANRAFDERFEPTSKAYIAALQALVDSQRAQTTAAAANAKELSDRASMLLTACCVLSLTLGTLLAWALTRSITQPLRLADAMAHAIAKLDLTQAAQTEYASDETGRLLRSIDTMRTALTRSLNEVRGVADGISTASTQIAVGNQDLSARTEQTASNLQQTASSMEQLTGTVRQSADSASQANQLASSATQVAERGGRVVSQVVATMEDINSSSKRIADIIGVIDGIAFQTNILALNAAVEAARAGEQGRGFAVVASEVRSLAQRSAEAAKEIKSVIGASNDTVEAGAGLVDEAGSSMTDIVSSVKRVSDIINEIMASTAEQSAGISQVNQAVTNLDHTTQQNAALVEEAAAAATSMQEQTAQVSSLMGRFTLGK
jgi:methyl-accepting chemotaxis protein